MAHDPEKLDLMLESVLACDGDSRSKALDDLCVANPDLAPTLRARFDALQSLGLLDEAEDDVTMPERIGEFAIRERIGAGGMGVVFRAYQESLGRDVALKVLRPELALFGIARQRFDREAAVVAKLEHPNIVPVFEVGQADGVAYLAMAYVDGCSLATLMKSIHGRVGSVRAMDLVTACAAAVPNLDRDAFAVRLGGMEADWNITVAMLLAYVADALQHAHERGVVHRDVKPSNVMVRADGRPMLLDFGLARYEGGATLTRSGAMLGSVPYTAPEQLEGKAVDARSDVFSFGAMLYEMLTGQSAFDASSPEVAIHEIMTKDPPDLHRLGGLGGIVARCLEKDPARRYATAGEVAADLRAFVSSSPLAAPRQTAVRRFGRFVRREPLRAAVYGMCLTLLLGAVGFGGYVYGQADEVAAGREKLDADRREAMLAEAFTTLVRVDHVRAEQRFRAVLSEWPADPIALAGLAMSCGEDARDVSDPAARAFVASLWSSLGGERGDATGRARGLANAREAIVRSDRARLLFHVGLANAAHTVGDESAARLAAEALEQHWPDSAVAAYWSGFALLDLDTQLAISHLRRAISLDDSLAWAHGALGVARLRNRDGRGAIESLERSIEIDDADPRTHVDLGIAYLYSDEPARSVPILQRATELAPRFPGAFYNLGVALMNSDGGAALEAFAKAVELEPKYHEAWNNIGSLRYRLGEFDAAIEAFERVVELQPDWPQGWIGLGSAQARAGSARGAADAYSRLVTLMPNDRGHHAYLCQLLEHLGDSDALDAERARFRAAKETGK